VKALSSETTRSETNLKKLVEKAIVEIKKKDVTASGLIHNVNHCVFTEIAFHKKTVKVKFEC